MCGIAGFQGDFTQNQLMAMQALIAHRGPDDASQVYLNLDCPTGLAHQRLSIIDLSAEGRQPMSVKCSCCSNGATETQKIWLVYNGELYNHQALRAQLVQKGHIFTSHSDTEVLLHLYAEFGSKMLDKLNGIFAFALYDGRLSGQKCEMRPGDLLLARDGLGVKPLYYAQTASGFLFSSELKSLLTCPALDRSLDVIALQQYLNFLWSPAPRTPLQSIKKFEPGQAMLIRQGKVKHSWYYYDLPYGQAYLKNDEKQIALELAEQVKAAVKRQLIADVPVGAFLSGGLDSSAIVAMMKNLRPQEKIPCYTIGFEQAVNEGFAEDMPYAQQVAQHLQVDLNVLRINSNVIGQLGQMIYFMDEPQADPAPINAYLIAQAAQQNGIKVLMSGAGGDDIFSGYRRHFALQVENKLNSIPMLPTLLTMLSNTNLPGKNPIIRRLNKYFENYIGDPQRRIASYFLWGNTKHNFALFSNEVKQQLLNVDVLEPLLASLNKIDMEKNNLNKMLYLEAKHFLADHNLNYTDKATMAWGVETRVPLLDQELVKFATQIPPQYKQRGRLGKAIFKKAMEPYLPKNVIYRKKTGFGAPLRYWLNNELQPLVHDLLSTESIMRRGLFDAGTVQQLIKKNSQNSIDASYTIFSLISIELWCRMFIDKPIPAPIDINL